MTESQQDWLIRQLIIILDDYGNKITILRRQVKYMKKQIKLLEEQKDEN